MKISNGTLIVDDISSIGPSEGLVCWYPLMRDTRDYVGGNHGINDGGILLHDGGYSFSGGSIIAPFFDAADFTASDKFTLSSWFKTTSAGCIFSIHYRVTAPLRGIDLFVQSTTNVSMHVSNTWTSDAFRVRTERTGLNDDEWHHLVITYNGNKGRSGSTIYVDGDVEPIEETDEDNLTSEIITVPGQPIRIAGRTNADGSIVNSLTGSIRDVRIYNRELTEDETKEIYRVSSLPKNNRVVIRKNTIYGIPE